ncbi:Extracellular ribonuclease precursor [Acholeplasma oculi]|nr:Endonuclease I [Acholeplasma oculi]SUT91804.1 Extracellular ribonuclease precursor [Acholeplasma oculi]
MQNMKKTIYTIFMLILMFVMVACVENTETTNPLEAAKEAVSIQYQEGDSPSHVTKNIQLPILIEGYPDVLLSWTSSKPEVIQINGLTGVVSRQSTDQEVIITAHLKLGEFELNHPNTLNVIKLGETEDTVAPVISGAKNIEVELGGTPDYLLGVTAVDQKDGSVTVTVDDSLVKLDTAGVYDLVYKASDSSGNEATVTVKVRVVAESAGEVLVYRFEFPGDDLGHGYSDPALTGDITNSINNEQFTIEKKRANTGAADEGLVLSGASASDTGAYVVFDFGQAVHKISFYARVWGEADLTNLLDAKLQEKVGDAWVDVLDIKQAINGSFTFVEITVENLNNSVYRFYVNGQLGTSNTSRVVFDDLLVYTFDGEDLSPTFEGLKDLEVLLGDDLPNLLEGIKAYDSFGTELVVVVLENTVDMNVAGTYIVSFKATDSFGRDSIKEITVTVMEAVGEVVTVKETFDTLTIAGSSYVAGTFTGVNGIVWTYSGANAGTPLNGNAITFGGRNTDNSSIKATIPGGLATLSIAYKKPFTNSQDYAVLINNQQVGLINAQNADGVFTYVLPTPITNGFTLEIKPLAPTEIRRQLTIDDITWTTSPVQTKPQDQVDAESDRNQLVLETSFIEAKTINFPATGSKGSQITYSFKNVSDTNNALINLSTGAISVPANGRVEVLVEATITKGEFTVTKTFTFILGEGDAITIANARLLSNSAFVRVNGVVTSIYKTSNMMYFFITDASGSIYVESDLAKLSTLQVGDRIDLRGSKNTISNQVSINTVRSITKLGTDTVTATQITANQIQANDARFVQLYGLIQQNYAASTDAFILNAELGAINLVIPANLSSAEKTNIQNKLTGKTPGLGVLVKAPIQRIGNSYYLVLTNSADITPDSTVDTNQVKQVILANVNLPVIPQELAENLNLTSSNSLLFGATITWTSSNTNALTNSGLVTRGQNDVSLTLSYSISYQSEVIDTRNYSVTVLKIATYEGYYASLANKTGSQLQQALRDLIQNTGRATGSTSQVQQVDSYQGKYYLIYTGFGAYGNREHVWPNSKLGSAPDYDLHNLRAANTSVNSTRSNYPFGPGSGSWKLSGGQFYPGDEHIGDVARIVLYIHVRYNLNISLVGNLQMFLNWHLADPVSDFEISRNNKIESIQSNRNPFIDHPELVGVLFGS